MSTTAARISSKTKAQLCHKTIDCKKNDSKNIHQPDGWRHRLTAVNTDGDNRQGIRQEQETANSIICDIKLCQTTK